MGLMANAFLLGIGLVVGIILYTLLIEKHRNP